MRLELRHKQELVMTPALQQALNILQMSTLELQDELGQEMLENPTLEEEKSSEVEEAVVEAQLLQNLLGEQSPQELSFSLDAWREYFGDSSTDLGDTERLPDRKGDYLRNAVAHRITLYEHLLRQWSIVARGEKQRTVGEAILGNLDDEGYLRDITLEEIASTAKAERTEVESALKAVQELDPPGVGARDLQECLLLQLGWDPKDALCRTIVQDHFSDLKRKNSQKLARDLSLPLDRVRGAVDHILSLEPKPGRAFSVGTVEYVTPDVLVEKNENDFDIRLTHEGVPRLRLSPYYLRVLREVQEKGADAVGEVKDYLRKKIQSALWFMRSVQERQKTLLRVARSLFRIQREFLEHGVLRLKPLRLVDVADDIGVHESTVARAVRGKYAQTPRGLYRLKFFFTPGLPGSQQEAISSRAIQARISDLVGHENRRHPLSDSKIVEILEKKGIQVARRTVAKYRDLLKILPTSQRKTYT